MRTAKLAHIRPGRAGQIIRRVFQDLVKSASRVFPDQLDEVIAETVEFLSKADAREHRLSWRPTSVPAPPALADRILLEQVLINLIRNGMEAMGEKPSATGEVRLTTEANMP